MVAELDWFGTISDKGTAVGFVEAKTTVGGAVVEFAPLLVGGEPDNEVEPEGVAEGLALPERVVEVAWRSIKCRRM